MEPDTITFEHNGATHTATIGEPAVPVENALTVEHEGLTYAILVSFGSGEFVARPALTEAPEYPLLVVRP